MSLLPPLPTTTDSQAAVTTHVLASRRTALPETYFRGALLLLHDEGLSHQDTEEGGPRFLKLGTAGPSWECKCYMRWRGAQSSSFLMEQALPQGHVAAPFTLTALL